MSTRKRRSAVTLHEVMEFYVSKGTPNLMSGSHTHTDIELNFVQRGTMEYFLAGKFHTIEAGSWAAFWAGTPHELVRVEPETVCIWVVLPLSWLAQWRLPESFTESLMSGEFIMASDDFDATVFERWADEFVTANAFLRETIALEVQALLRRLSVNHQAKRKSRPVSTHTSTHNVEAAAAKQLETMARYISQHYREELSAETIARAVNLHPKYAMQVFKNGCGMSLWEYVLRLRVSHAQRLLMSSDLTVERVGIESGFGSTSRFYEAFAKYTGQTPRAFRKLHE